MNEIQEKIVYVATRWKDDPESASLPFVLANAALLLEVKAVVVLQKDAVYLALPNSADEIITEEFPPLKDLIASFLVGGGELLVCTPCMKPRKITEEMLIPQAIPVAGARVTMEMLSAKATVSY